MGGLRNLYGFGALPGQVPLVRSQSCFNKHKIDTAIYLLFPRVAWAGVVDLEIYDSGARPQCMFPARLLKLLISMVPVRARPLERVRCGCKGGSSKIKTNV